MITLEQLKVFEKYKGDPDAFTRASQKTSKILAEDDFFALQRLISDLKLIGNGVAAASYEAKVFEQINSLVNSDQKKGIF